MEIDDILQQLADIVGKRKGDLKRTFNSIMKKKTEEEGLTTDALPIELLNKIVIYGVCTKYGIDTKKADEIIDGKSNKEDEKDEQVNKQVPKQKNKQKTKQKIEKKMNDENPWQDIFDSIKDPAEYSGEGDDDGDSFETLPTLKPQINVKYYVRLREPDIEPYKHEGESTYGKYASYAVKVDLLKVSPDDIDPVETNKPYTVWMGTKLPSDARAKMFEHFAKFWKDIGSAPDDREFFIRKTQKVSKKTGRNYNVFTFGEV